MTSSLTYRHEQSQQLLEVLNKLHGATSGGVYETGTEEVIKEFLDWLKALPFDLLPYAAVSQFLYSNESEDLLNFIEILEQIIFEYFRDDFENVDYKKGMKIIEHLELAKQQKDNLFLKHEQEIKRIKKIAAHNAKKSVEIQQLQEKTETLQTTTEELQEDNQKIMTNYISILGIFAAILMGAFGSIQGFSSIFNNAHNLHISDILIISSIGASSVILILFFLLNGIAKLTGKRLSSSTDDDSPILKKHPTLVITHLVLVLLSLIGTSIKLSNIHLQFAFQGFWWLLPLAWFIYCLRVYKKKSLWIFKQIEK